MNVQLVIVVLCIAVAVAFMAKRFVGALQSKGCADCEKDCKHRSCAGGGECVNEKKLRELRPSGKPFQR